MGANNLVGAVQCPLCKDIIISRYHHDCHFCSCGKTMVDGGREYMRVGYHPDHKPLRVQIKLVGGLDFRELAQSKRLGTIKTRKLVCPTLYSYTLNRKGKFYRYPTKAAEMAIEMFGKA